MSLEDKNRLIKEGQAQLKKGIFPNLILESINESRLRKDVEKQIFNPSGEKFDNLSKEDQDIKKSRLAIILKFNDYIQALNIFKNGAYLLLILGIITLGSALLKINNNHIFGLLTFISGLIILIASSNRKLLLKTTLYIVIVYLVFTLLELIIFKLPSPYIYAISNNVLENRRGALPKIINLISPFVYLTIRLSLVVFFIGAYLKQQSFFKIKSKYELGIRSHS